MKWLDVAQTSDLTGLKEATLRGYARSHQSSLRSGIDYRIRKYRALRYQRKQLLFSQRGIDRIVRGDYSVYSWDNRPVRLGQRFKQPETNASKHGKRGILTGQNLTVPPSPDELVFPEHSTPTDKARIARDHVTRCVTYLLEHPCAKDGCGCVCHAMLPGLNAMMELYNHDLQNKSTVIGRQHAAPREETGLLTGRQLGQGYVPRYR